MSTGFRLMTDGGDMGLDALWAVHACVCVVLSGQCVGFANQNMKYGNLAVRGRGLGVATVSIGTHLNL